MKTKVWIAMAILLIALIDVVGFLSFSLEAALFSVGRYAVSIFTLAAVVLAVMVLIDRKK